MTDAQHVADAFDRAYAGGPERHREKSAQQGKLPVRERVQRLPDEGSFSEDALVANWEAEGLGADGVVTGLGTIAGRTVALMANDPTVKAGSWGAQAGAGRAGRPAGAHRGADGQRPDGQGRLVGPQDRREDPAHPGGRARAPGADGLPGCAGSSRR